MMRKSSACHLLMIRVLVNMRIPTIGIEIAGHTTAAMIKLLARDSLWWSKLGVTPGGAGAAPIGFADEFIVGPPALGEV